MRPSAPLLAFVLLLTPFLVLASPPSDAPMETGFKVAAQHLMHPAPGAAAKLPEVRDTPTYGTRAQTTGTVKVVVLLVEFSDVSRAPSRTVAFFDGMMNDATAGTRSFHNYYLEASYGQLTVEATVVSTWFRSARTMSYYGGDSPSGVDDATGPIYRLVAETVALADSTVDFSQFDTDADGVVDHVLVIHAGGAQEESGQNRDIWSHRWAVVDASPTIPGDQRLVADGVQIYGYTMVSEDSPVGVAVHEFGHDLGLPDLYDTDGSSEGAGDWDLMAGGSWNGVPPGSVPAHLSSWSKIRLGWLTPTEVTAPILSASIPALSAAPSAYRLPVTSSPGGNEYFLVENRQPIGFDAGLPGSGLLIWHVDDSVASNDDDRHRMLDLEEADEASGEEPTQATDAWFDNAAGWGPDSVPSSAAHGNIPTGWKVRNIGPSGATMTADLSREVDDDLALLAILHEPFTDLGSPVAVSVAVANLGVRPQGAVNVTVSVHPGRASAEAAYEETRTTPALASGAVANVTGWSFPTNASIPYIVRAHVDLPGDEIPENNERLSHVSVSNLYLFDDVESGPAGWTSNDGPTNENRWEIVTDGGTYGSFHSPNASWRFGYFGANPFNPFPPTYHTLTSAPVAVPGGPLFLNLYQRYDLWGRSETPTIINASETDHGYVEVRVDSGPWVQVGHMQGKQLAWQGFSENLTGFAPAGGTVRVRFNVTSSVMPQSGGWWIDDIALSDRSLGYGVGVISVVSRRSVEPGDTARFPFKVVNLGDFEDDFRFSIALPAGWTATLTANASTSGPVDTFTVRLRPDAEALLRLAIRTPPTAARGTKAIVPLGVASSGSTAAADTFPAVVEINDPLGLGALRAYLPWILVAFVTLVVIAFAIDRAKRRRGVPPVW